jgi:hypothetical protein
MVNTPNLDIEHLQPNSDQPEVVVNTALDAIDAKITGTVPITIGATNIATLTQDEQAAGSIFVLTNASPGPSGAITVNFAPFGMGLFSVFNDTAFTATLRISGQSITPPTLLTNTRGIFQCDGDDVVKLV